MLKQAEVVEQACKAATAAHVWRCKLQATLSIWDVLYCRVEPISKGQTYLQRIEVLLEMLWPDAAAVEVCLLSGNQQIPAPIRDRIDQLFQQTVSPSQLEELQTDLRSASGALGNTLQEGFAAAQSAAALKAWLLEVAGAWRRLCGEDRLMFAAAFDLGPAIRLAEERLGATTSIGKSGFCESELLRICSHSGDPSLLYRLVECHGGTSIDVHEMLQEFLRQREPEKLGDTTQEELQRRFGFSLLALQGLGVITHRQGRQKTSGSGWTIAKRNFGRVWHRQALKEYKPANSDISRSVHAKIESPIDQKRASGDLKSLKLAPPMCQRFKRLRAIQSIEFSEERALKKQRGAASNRLRMFMA